MTTVATKPASRQRHHRNRLHDPCQTQFYDLYVANQSQLPEQALDQILQLYGMERKCKDLLSEERQQEAVLFLDALYQWLICQ